MREGVDEDEGMGVGRFLLGPVKTFPVAPEVVMDKFGKNLYF